jgi:hypothetical protein
MAERAQQSLGQRGRCEGDHEHMPTGPVAVRIDIVKSAIERARLRSEVVLPRAIVEGGVQKGKSRADRRAPVSPREL